MAEHHYTFGITMSCSGCSGAVERVLARLDGVKSYDVSLASQTAEIVTDDSVPYLTLLEKIKKTGKRVNSALEDGQSLAVQ